MKVLQTTLLALIFTASTQVNASATIESYATNTAIPTTIGSFDMTRFDLTNDVLSGTTSSTGSAGSELNFVDRNGNAIDMMRSTADSQTWWQNGETFNYDTFLISGVSWIEIILPENTRAISFNVGANQSASGWLNATSQTTNASGTVTTGKDYFNVGPTNTPGFGISADNNSVDSCTTLTSVVIDPIFIWGFGNFSINQDECPTSVPEANSIYLLAIGLFGLMLVARRKV